MHLKEEKHLNSSIRIFFLFFILVMRNDEGTSEVSGNFICHKVIQSLDLQAGCNAFWHQP